MNCTFCKRPIVLIPSAAERAAKDVTGRPASFFTSLFTEHSECTLEKRRRDMSEFLKRKAEANAGKNPNYLPNFT